MERTASSPRFQALLFWPPPLTVPLDAMTSATLTAKPKTSLEKRAWQVITIVSLVPPGLHLVLLLLAVPFGVSAPAVWVAENLLISGSAITVIWLLLVGGPLVGVIGSLILGLWPQRGLSVGTVCGGIGWTLLLLGMGTSFPVPWILFFAAD